METLIYVVATQIVLIPILGGIWHGIRMERLQYKRMLALSIANTIRRRTR